jgi:TetR/AcrR family tetracycline transcriptional repressor
VKASRGRARKKAGSDRAQPLSEQDIVAGAMEIVRREGLDQLGMRGLAQALGVSPMAIYYHVPSKEALLLQVAESVLAQVPTPAPTRESWQQQLKDHAMSTWELLSSYPGLSSFVLERPPAKAARRLSRHAFSVLREAGFDERGAAHGVLTLQTYMFGLLSVQSRAVRYERHRALATKKAGAGPAEQSDLMRLLQDLSPRAWMEIGLDTVLAGLQARLAAASSARAAKKTMTRDQQLTRTESEQ